MLKCIPLHEELFGWVNVFGKKVLSCACISSSHILADSDDVSVTVKRKVSVLIAARDLSRPN